MPNGLFRTADQSAQVEYDGVSIPIPRLDRVIELCIVPPGNRGSGVVVMSEQELREFKAAMEKLRLENTSSREKATQFLKEEGFLDENGEVSKRYSASVAVA